MTFGYTFILASASPRREALVRQIGLDPVIIPADADESFPDGVTDPGDIVQILAGRKARAAVIPEDISYPAVILGADTVVVKDGRIFGKPADEEDAFRMLKELSGNRHEVNTGICLILLGEDKEVIDTLTDICVTGVHFSDISDEDIRRYINTGEPMDKAGSYGIQGPFAAFVDRIEGEYSNVVGLPLALVRKDMEILLTRSHRGTPRSLRLPPFSQD